MAGFTKRFAYRDVVDGPNLQAVSAELYTMASASDTDAPQRLRKFFGSVPSAVEIRPSACCWDANRLNARHEFASGVRGVWRAGH